MFSEHMTDSIGTIVAIILYSMAVYHWLAIFYLSNSGPVVCCKL